MNSPQDETGAIFAKGPVSGVTVHSHMRIGPHAVVTDPLDLIVIVELMFLLAEQTRRSQTEAPFTVTPQSLLERLKELGVKSGNGARLVGRDAVYESFARLRAKGYIRRISLKDSLNKITGVAYEFYEFPAWNPEAPALSADTDSESPQVGATSGNAGYGNAGNGPKGRTSQSSSQVGATSGNAGYGNAGNGSGKRRSSQVGATSGNAGSPPHPPEEVTTSSPYPHTGRRGARSLLSQTEGEGAGYAKEDLKAAADVLQLLPDPWTQGKLNADKLAPKLLTVMAEQGWPDVHTVDRALLSKQIGKNPKGVTNGYRLLASDRIPNLPLYAAVARTTTKIPDGPSAGPAEIECDKGCDRGYMEIEDGLAPCSCLPLRQASTA